MTAITRQHCPACGQGFPVRSGGTIPYRCPYCVKLVLGPYCDLEWIGGGGMGDVYRAREPGAGDRTVAIKVPRTDFDPQRATRRFEHEVAASARLQHENAVHAYHRAEEGGRPYLVMEYVAGPKLRELVRPDVPLAPQRVTRILSGIARGLAHAAPRGVVNRDIQPDNVLLAEPDERPKILDYGLALIRGADERVTRPESMLGSPHYAAPEQARDPQGVTIAAGVYSLGCTAVFCLTGGPPFPEGNLGEVVRLHAAAPRPSVRTLRPDLPEAFDALIQAMMAIEPQQRPSPQEVVDALQTMRDDLPGEPAPPAGGSPGARIDAECPRCGTVYHLLPSAAGKPMQCPNKLCRATFVVPLPTSEALEVIEAEIADPDGSRESPAGVVEGEIADVPSTDVPLAAMPPAGAPPDAASAAGVHALPSGVVPGPPPTGRARARRRSGGRQRFRLPWAGIVILVGLVLGILLLSPHVPWDVLFPNPEPRWAEIVRLLDEKKWDRVVRKLERFEEDFPESPRVNEISFFTARRQPA